MLLMVPAPLDVSQESGFGSNGRDVHFYHKDPQSGITTFISSVENVTDMAALTPPGPDPSGITYVPGTNTFLIVDGEVEETIDGVTHFQGTNVWELTLDGQVVRTANISKQPPYLLSMSDEPVGIAYNPENGHFYVSEDKGTSVFDVNPGMDGVVFTEDDSWRSFDTKHFGNGDPEGITYNTWDHHIYVVDGFNQEIYIYTTSGSLVRHFDVGQYGLDNPESVEFNADAGTLFIMSSVRSSHSIIECTTEGELLQVIDISEAGPLWAAGLAYAPASDGSGEMRLYIVDRGVDNDTDPTAVDGLLIEMSAPGSVVGELLRKSWYWPVWGR